MNTIQRLAAGTVLASVPLMSVGCCVKTSNHPLFVSLNEVRDRLPGGAVFDENSNGVLDERELETYFRVMLNRPEGERFNQADLKEMKTIASNLKLSHPSYKEGLPLNIKNTWKNLQTFIKAQERITQDKQDNEIRERKNKMFPPLMVPRDEGL